MISRRPEIGGGGPIVSPGVVEPTTGRINRRYHPVGPGDSSVGFGSATRSLAFSQVPVRRLDFRVLTEVRR